MSDIESIGLKIVINVPSLLSDFRDLRPTPAKCWAVHLRSATSRHRQEAHTKALYTPFPKHSANPSLREKTACAATSLREKTAWAATSLREKTAWAATFQPTPFRVERTTSGKPEAQRITPTNERTNTTSTTQSCCLTRPMKNTYWIELWEAFISSSLRRT